MPDNALEDLMKTLSAELDERLEVAAGKRLHFVLIATDHLEPHGIATNTTASGVKILAELLRDMADELERRH